MQPDPTRSQLWTDPLQRAVALRAAAKAAAAEYSDPHDRLAFEAGWLYGAVQDLCLEIDAIRREMDSLKTREAMRVAHCED